MFIILLTFLFVFSSISVAFADDAGILVDVFIFRPVGLATLISGSAIFVVSLPWAAISGSIPETAKALVVKPFKYTFIRSVGENDIADSE